MIKEQQPMLGPAKIYSTSPLTFRLPPPTPDPLPPSGWPGVRETPSASQRTLAALNLECH